MAHCKVLQDDVVCRDLFYEALKYHLLVDRRSEMTASNGRLKPRSCFGKTKQRKKKNFHWIFSK